MEQKYLTVQQISDIWAVSTQTVLKWIEQGCPAFRPGNSWRLDPEAVRRWAEERAANRR